MIEARLGVGLFATAGILALVQGCSSHGVRSGSAVGQMGRGLTSHARAVPQGAEACAMHDALQASTPGTPEKSVSETCGKALNSDILWRRGLVVLSAYSGKLGALAAGEDPEKAGQLDGAMVATSGDDWVDVETEEEKSAKDAIGKLGGQLTAKESKADLDQTVKDAAPHVKTICSGLRSYLDAQATKFGEIHAEIEKKRAAKSDRRCATFDNRTICVNESMTDRLVYANAFGEIAMQEQNHLDARDDVAAFCVAHEKLEAAAGSGDTNNDETYAGIVEAVKGVPRTRPKRPAAGAAAAGPEKNPATAPDKKPAAPEKNPATQPDKKPLPAGGAAAPDKK